MSFGSSKKKKSGGYIQYEKFKDTPWITQGRQIADIGGQGVLDNYNKVNVFSPETQQSLEARNNAIYQRAFDDASRAYTDTMNRYNAANYGQFGTLNATAPYYRTDSYQRDFQRQLNDLAYNKAVNYENLVNNELQRRYNTLNMFGDMYGYGQIPHSVDIANWNTTNTNKDLLLKQMQMDNASSGGWSNLLGTLGTVAGTAAGAYFGCPSGAAAGSQVGNSLGSGIGGII